MVDARLKVEFIKGMVLHDIAKPMYLPGYKHTVLGYLILTALGRPEAGLVSLVHHNDDRTSNLKWRQRLLRKMKDVSAMEVPGIFILSSGLDVLSSAAYSSFKEKPSTEGLMCSVQNPFTRLPVRDADLAADANGDTQSHWDGERWRADVHQTKLGAETREKLNEIFRCDFARSVAKDGWPSIEENIDQLFSSDDEEELLVAGRLLQAFRELAEDRRTLQVLRKHMGKFAERTYPAPNDTMLAQHAQLAACLTLVVMHNLENETVSVPEELTKFRESILAKPIRRSDEKFFVGRQQITRPLIQNTVATHLQCSAVRVVFGGFRHLFQNAGRTDDIRGTHRVVRELVMPAFKRQMAQALILGTDEIGEPVSFVDTELSNALALAQGAFDLMYLVPGESSEEEIGGMVFEAYSAAIAEVVDGSKGLLPNLERDFEKVKDRLDVGAQRNGLVEQLRAMPVAVGISEVSQPSDPEDYDDFCGLFSDSLRKAYLDAVNHVTVPMNSLGAARHRQVGDEVCEVCGANSIWEKLNELAETEEFVRKVLHEFRGEPEQICVSCAAIRVMSHGLVDVPILSRLITRTDDGKLLVHEAEEGFPDIPPLMVRSGDLAEEYVDLGAAFVRDPRDPQRRVSGELDIFPTVSYAADENSNVALIHLEPLQESLFKAYSFQDFIRGDGFTQASDFADFNAYYGDLCRKMEGERESQFENMVNVKPHFARVLQRISWIRDFFGNAQGIFEQHQIRALPIADQYPSLFVAVPASRLVDAVSALHEGLTSQLFSSGQFLDESGGGKMGPSLAFLDQIVPKLLYGSVTIFKHKQPLYLVMSAAQRMLDELDQMVSDGDLEDWSGVLLGFADLRGVLSEGGMVQAISPYSRLYDVVDMSSRVDRRSMLSATALMKAHLGPEEQKLPEDQRLPPIVGAPLYLRGQGQIWGKEKPEILDALQRNRYFKPVVFLRRMAGSGQ